MEDIKILKEFIGEEDARDWQCIDCGFNRKGEIKAIENVLARLEQLEKENEEYRKDYVEYKKQEPQQLSIKKLAEEILKLKEENTRLRIENSAIDTTLNERIHKLEKENESKEKAYTDCYCDFKHYKQFESVPKSVIREKLEFYKRYGKVKNSDEYVMSVEIELLEELLGDE